VLLALLLAGPVAAEPGGPAVVLTVEGAIGPATAGYLRQGLATAAERRAELVILRLDTPGGLMSSLHDIVRDILASPVPVVGFVAPSGARAASAGTFILYACQIAAMAPATNLGAATPVTLGPQADGEPKAPAPEGGGDALAHKAINDAAASIRGLAELRGRNAEWAEQAVREAASLSANEALARHVIDLIATDTGDLLTRLDGRMVTVDGVQRPLQTAGLAVETLAPDWRTEVLSVLSDPNLAFILMLLGVYGLIFELANPGLVVPGVIGAISLVFGLYALSVLPVNYAGLGMIFLGIAFMVGEAFMPTFGILGVGGVTAFVIGATLLFDTSNGAVGLSWAVILGTAATTALMLTLSLWLGVRAHRRPVVTGAEGLIGVTATVVSWSEREGQVFVLGELWRARGPSGLAPGQPVRITAVRGLTVTVSPAPPAAPDSSPSPEQRTAS
jgi:membrane-bound serine protease (ClpP class)